jgi:microcin C transport system permease protein
MTSYILRRLLLIIPTLLGISLACFLLIQFVPGGPVEEMISRIQGFSNQKGGGAKTISPAEVANIKAYFGFDRPAHERYIKWLGNLLQGNFGDSYIYHRPVLDVILSKVPLSLFFGLSSFFLAYLISIPLGTAKAIRNGSFFDTATSILIFAGYVCPAMPSASFSSFFLVGALSSTCFPFPDWSRTISSI